MKRLSIKEIEEVAFLLAQETMQWNEPIPDFSTRFPDKLESCIATPFQTYAKRSLYKGDLAKAAILFYLLIKNHPFQNGNKRIAVVSVLYFLFKNKKWLKVNNQEFYNFARWVAESNPRLKTEVVKAIEKFISTYVSSL